jgi:hypothetical protein
MDFPAENTRFNQCSREFYDFTENVIFARPKKSFFVIASWTQISAFEGGKTGAANGQFLPAPGPSN